MGKKEIEEKAVQLNMLENKMGELEQEAVMLEKQMNELQLCQLALDELKNIKPETEMLAPISSGVFLRAKLLNNKEIIIDNGSKIFSKKNPEDAKEFLQKKINHFEELHERLSHEINSIIEVITNIEQELRKMIN